MITVVIPVKNEKYIRKTVESLLENAVGDVEVLFREDYGIGQRGITNELVREARGDLIMKTDGHCLFSKGWDKSMVSRMMDNMIMAPYLLSLDEETWTPRHAPLMSEYGFDSNLIMQHLPSHTDDLVVETMCLQGSCWLVTKENYWKWNLGELGLGSWGMQGTELGIKAYLNGGVCVTNKDCYYAHLFRQLEVDFPYQRDMKAIEKTKNIFIQKYKRKNIKGLIEKFNYPLDWDKEKVDNLE